MSYPIETIRHSLAHVMAAAVKKLYPDVKFAGGPAIENGFYYDFDTEHRFSEEDFGQIDVQLHFMRINEIINISIIFFDIE